MRWDWTGNRTGQVIRHISYGYEGWVVGWMDIWGFTPTYMTAYGYYGYGQGIQDGKDGGSASFVRLLFWLLFFTSSCRG